MRSFLSARSTQDCIAGTVAGVLGLASIYPLDTAKCRMQATASAANSSVSQVLRGLIKVEGVRGMYRGLSAPATGFGVVFAIGFSSNQFAREAFQAADARRREAGLPAQWSGDDGKLGPLASVLAGSLAGLAQTPCRQVIERTKTVMQVRDASSGRAEYPGPLTALRRLVVEQGLRNGLCQGMTATMWREIPQGAVYYLAYDAAKRGLTPLFTDETSGPTPMAVAMLAGSFAGFAQWLPPFYWADVFKTRLQGAKAEYAGLTDCVRQSLAKEGVRVLTRGQGLALVRGTPMHGVIFVAYELVARLLRDTFPADA